MFDYSIWGLNSTGYHLQNIFWHIVTVIFIYKIIRYFDVKIWVSFLLCLIFAVHPQRVESVVWLSERKDVLCAAFYFMSIYFYITADNKKLNKYFSFLLFLVSILSKPMSVTLPAILILFEFHKEKTLKPWYYINKFWPFILVSIASVPISIISQTGAIDAKTSLLLRIIISLYNDLWYLKQFFYPENLVPIYPKFSHSLMIYTVIPSYAFVILFSLILFFKKKKLFIYSIFPLIAGYVVTLFPVSEILLLEALDHADR